MNVLKSIMVPIHKEGFPFIILFASLSAALFWYLGNWGFVGIVLTIWCAYFFRDPKRVTPARDGLVISPADGIVQLIELASPPQELGIGKKMRQRVSIFMNVFNVHVNRAPINGSVQRMAYRPGSFVNASLDKASEDNERMGMLLKTADGVEIICVQIAGLVARRIICWVSENQELAAGERFGMIRFGSRVDIYLPDSVSPLVCLGQTVVAGETVLADLKTQEPKRTGLSH